MAIAAVQSTHGGSSESTGTITFGANVTGGSLLTFALQGTTNTVSTVYDSLGNDWQRQTVIVGVQPATLFEQWYARNASAGTVQVSFVNPQPGTFVRCAVQEWSGLSTTAPVVESTYAIGTSSNIATPTVGTDASSVLAIASFVFNSAYAIATPPSGWTALDPSTALRHQQYYRIYTSTAQVAADIVTSTAEVYAASLMLYRDQEVLSVGGSRRPFGGLLRGVR